MEKSLLKPTDAQVVTYCLAFYGSWKLINVHKTPSLGPLLNNMNPDHMFTAHSCTLHLISLPYPPYIPQLVSSLKIFLRKL